MRGEMGGWTRGIGCVLTALLFVTANPGVEFFFLAYLCLVPFLYSIDDRTPWQAALIGLATGAIAWFGLMFWMRHIAWIALLGVVLYEAIWWSLFTTLWVRWRSPLKRALLGPVLWVSLEWLRSLTPLGFSWGALGLTHYRQPLFIQAAAWGGVPLLSYTVAAGSFAAWYWMRHTEKRGRRLVLIPLLLIPLVYAGGGIALRGAEVVEETPPVGIVQGDIPADLKLHMDWGETYWRHVDLSREALDAGAELVVWPESMSVFPLLRQPQVLTDIEIFVMDHDVDLLMGSVEAIRVDGQSAFYNSAYFFPRDILPATPPVPLPLEEPILSATKLVRYDKVLLVPFGEYVPGKEFLPFIDQAVQNLQGGAFTPGREIVLFEWREWKMGALICFESTFSGHARAMVQDGADILVNMTNDAWFGPWGAPYQHLSHSVLRAVENRVPVVRAANSGVSCVIDPRGRIIAEEPIFQETWLTARVPLEAGETFYSKFGDVFALGLLIVLIASLFLPRQRRGPEPSGPPVGGGGGE